MKFLIIFLLFLLCIPVAQALTIQNETGTTYINWTWGNISEPQSVYVDGILKINNGTSLGYYVLTNLQPNEEHRIDVYSNTTWLYNATKYDMAKTKESAWYFPLIFTVVFMILGGYFSFYFSYLSIISAFWGLMTVQKYTSTEYIIVMYGFLFMFSLYVTYEMHKRRVR